MVDSALMDASAELFDAVRGHYLFSGLADADFEQLAGDIRVCPLDKGEVLFHRGDRAEAFYFVGNGLIEISLISATGEKKTLEVVESGATFGEAIAFMREHKYPATAEALRQSVLCRIPNAPYLSLLKSNTDACLRLLADVSRHLHARVREIESLTIRNAKDRLASYLLDHIVDTPADDRATVRLDLPRHVIASRLSIKPETLSRLLRTLADDGVITVEDRVVFVHSLSRLRPYD